MNGRRPDAVMAAAFLVLALPVYQGGCRGASSPTPRAPVAGTMTQAGEDSFSDGAAMQRYTAYSDGPQHWEVRGGSLVGTGPAEQSVLIRRGVEMTDGWVEAVSSVANDGGLVLRFRGPDDYYLLAFRDDRAPAPRGEYNLAMYHHVGGEYRELWRTDVRWPRGMRRTVRFEAEGPHLRAYVDGEPMVDLVPSPAGNDPSPYAGRGGFGMRNYGADGGWITKFSAFRWHASSPLHRAASAP